MYPIFRIADSSYVFGAPYGEEVERRSRILSTNLTMANADADRLALDPKSNFAAIAAARPIPHLELPSRFPNGSFPNYPRPRSPMTAERRVLPFPRAYGRAGIRPIATYRRRSAMSG